MSGRDRITFPPGEAPAAEAREEAALARELAPDSAPLDITFDEPPAEPSRVARGVEAIRAFWRHAPLGPGVYRMIGSEGEVLYVGKARSIKKRIAAYMAPERQQSRIARMVAQTHSMVFVTTESDAEALLLEANLIKQLKPRYNVTLRDDKSFPYILICADHAAAEADQASRRAQPGWRLFRPVRERRRGFPHPQRFAAGVSPAHLLGQFLRQSNAAVPAPSDQALLGALHRGDRDPRLRQAGGGSARLFSQGAAARSKRRLGHEMNEAAAALDFESAARLRDRISALSAIQGEQSVNPRSIAEADVFAVTDEAGQFCVEVFFFRTYQNWGNRAYFPRADRALSREEVLDAFLAQFYLDRPAPRLVLLSHEVPSAVTPVRSVERARRASRRHRRAQARRKEGSRRRRFAQCATGSVAQARGNGDAGKTDRGAERGLRRRPSDPPRRDLRQFPHHGDERDRRDGGRWPRRLRQEPVPHFQHQERRSHAGRRLRHDARGADTAFRAPCAEWRDGGGRRLSRHA